MVTVLVWGAGGSVPYAVRYLTPVVSGWWSMRLLVFGWCSFVFNGFFIDRFVALFFFCGRVVHVCISVF